MGGQEEWLGALGVGVAGTRAGDGNPGGRLDMMVLMVVARAPSLAMKMGADRRLAIPARSGGGAG